LIKKIALALLPYIELEREKRDKQLPVLSYESPTTNIIPDVPEPRITPLSSWTISRRGSHKT